MIYFRCGLQTVYNLNYTPKLVEVEEKLHLRVTKQKMLNTTSLLYRNTQLNRGGGGLQLLASTVLLNNQEVFLSNRSARKD
jgi:hypothetical protein